MFHRRSRLRQRSFCFGRKRESNRRGRIAFERCQKVRGALIAVPRILGNGLEHCIIDKLRQRRIAFNGWLRTHLHLGLHQQKGGIGLKRTATG